MQRIAMVARWKPVHLGHAAVLRGLTAAAAHCFIGIGSSNRCDASNPFSARESEDMIRLVLRGAGNFSIFEVPDLDDGPRWRAHLSDVLGDVDCFVTANPYVAGLMAVRYEVVHPVEFVPVREREPIDGTMVRAAMLRGGRWQDMVPAAVARYLKAGRLVERFVEQFGETDAA